ncbi:NACHT domain-containing protein [Nocardiopsis baichengensis]|uniref:NACHT domain-containing protein n=1 Tax=Nocardiopsis baichengensis TaxID=280240 RepID=UPI0003458E00|nr:NACHT domain-containing protein [Nocardiopsis baichengensis]
MFDPALKLGTTVVKTALKLWLGDIPFASDIGATATDLLGNRVGNAMDRRRLQRRFDDFGDTIAQRIIDQLGQEFSGLPDNEREAAVLALTDSFEHARLTGEVLFDQDLDPLRLERHIRSRAPRATRDLGEAATAVYNRLFPECCAYTIATATSLPDFNAGALTELLRRDTVILDRLDQILRHLPKHSASDGQGKEAEFATAYRRKAAERWDRLELFGTDTRTRTYPLSLAYLSLNVALPDRMSDVHGQSDLFEWGSDRSSGGLQSAEAALAGNRRLFLRGAAGSGKTTLLHWIAVRASRSDFPPALAEWNGSVPFFLPLRRYVGERLPEPEEFIRPTGSHLQQAAPGGWVHRLLEDGRALLLVDGVDELPRDEREAARRWLRELISEFPRCRFVITSRPAAVAEDWLSRQDFTSAEVQPLRDDDVRAFIRYWHRAVRSEVADEEEQGRLERYEAELTSKVLGQRHLRSIASTPLLCALLCALYRDRRTALPRDRIEVYQAALAMLLADRDEQRGIPADGPSMSLTEKTQLLQELAKWLILNGSSDAPTDTAQRQIGRLLAVMHRVDGSAEEVFDHLMLRSGVLMSPAVDRVAFVHRTFEEYLAARALVEEDSLPLLIKHAHDDQWHEVVVMAAGQAGQRQREDLIRGLLERADGVKKHHDRLQIVALACLETSTTLSAGLRADIEARVRALLPPRTEAQVSALITAGEAAMPFLEDADLSDPRAAATTIRTAVEIGGDRHAEIVARALRARTKPTRGVLSEVQIAWSTSPTHDMARTALPLLPKEYTFRTRGDALGMLCEHAPHLRHLNIIGDQQTNLAPLADLQELRTLFLNGDRRADPWEFSALPLSDIPSLRAMIARTSTVLTDASPLRTSALDSLSLKNTGSTHEVEAISEIDSLHTLTLGADLPEPPLCDVLPPNLKHLAIRENPSLEHVSDLFPLDASPITHITLAMTPSIHTLDGLQDCGADLEGFSIIGETIRNIDLTPLTHFLDLTEISLEHQIFLDNEKAITKLDSLSTIEIYPQAGRSSPIPLPRWLADHPSLKRVSVLGRPILDLRELAGVENLTIEVRWFAPKKIIGADKLGPGSTVVRAPRPKY